MAMGLINTSYTYENTEVKVKLFNSHKHWLIVCDDTVLPGSCVGMVECFGSDARTEVGHSSQPEGL